MIGSTMDTDSMPSPPMIDRPSAPLSGSRSEMSASVVGQKNVIPTANTAAATNTKLPDAFASSCSPMNEKIAENHSIPGVLIRAAIEPAIARPIIMMPLMNASTSSALTPVADSRDSIRWLVPSSVAADSSMQKPTNR